MKSLLFEFVEKLDDMEKRITRLEKAKESDIFTLLQMIGNMKKDDGKERFL